MLIPGWGLRDSLSLYTSNGGSSLGNNPFPCKLTPESLLRELMEDFLREKPFLEHLIACSSSIQPACVSSNTGMPSQPKYSPPVRCPPLFFQIGIIYAQRIPLLFTADVGIQPSTVLCSIIRYTFPPGKTRASSFAGWAFLC